MLAHPAGYPDQAGGGGQVLVLADFVREEGNFGQAGGILDGNKALIRPVLVLARRAVAIQPATVTSLVMNWPSLAAGVWLMKVDSRAGEHRRAGCIVNGMPVRSTSALSFASLLYSGHFGREESAYIGKSSNCFGFGGAKRSRISIAGRLGPRPSQAPTWTRFSSSGRRNLTRLGRSSRLLKGPAHLARLIEGDRRQCRRLTGVTRGRNCDPARQACGLNVGLMRRRIGDG